jgi:hypothetical protein
MNQLHHPGLKAILAALWPRVAPTRDLPTIAFIRAGVLLRRGGPVPGILATHRPGALMDKSRLLDSSHREAAHELPGHNDAENNDR